jgi:hypothetical protein
MNLEEIKKSLFTIKDYPIYNLEFLQKWFILSFLLRLKRTVGGKSNFKEYNGYLKIIMLYFAYIIHTSENREKYLYFIKLQCSPF